jgi:hypothetical protein
MLDIPPAPLFKDEQERNLIPQVSLFTLLSKYDGKTETVRSLQIYFINIGRKMLPNLDY